MYVRGGAARLSRAEIRMSGDFLFRLSEGRFCSTVCPSQRRRGFLVVFEHELCHAAKTRSSVQLAILPASSRSPTDFLATTTRATAFRRACRKPLRKGFPRRSGLFLLSGRRVERNRHLCRKNGDGYGRRSKRRIPRSAGTALQQIPRSTRAFDGQSRKIEKDRALCIKI